MSENQARILKKSGRIALRLSLILFICFALATVLVLFLQPEGTLRQPVEANTPPPTYTLFITISPAGAVPSAVLLDDGTDADASVHVSATVVNITATPDIGWVFDHWEGDLTGTTNPTTVTMDDDRYVTAFFVLKDTPTAAFSGTPILGEDPLIVAFTDESHPGTSAITNWDWDFEDDGVVDSTDQHPVFTYLTPGTYTVSLTATNTSGASTETKTGYVDVRDKPTVDFVAGASTVSESYGALDLQAVLDIASASDTTLTVSVTSGTATGGGTDYTLLTTTLTFLAGETSKLVSLTIDEDLLDEDDETLAVTLSAPANAFLGTVTTHTVTITDNDDPPTIQFTVATSSVIENAGTVDVVVTLSATSGKEVTAWYALTDGTATGGGVDYTQNGNILVFAPGETSKTITVIIDDDVLGEPDEDFTITFLGGIFLANATLGTITSHVVTITNDGDLPGVSFLAASASVVESAGTRNLNVDLTILGTTDVTVDYAVTSGTATGGGVDYTLTAGTLTYDATLGETSKTITIPITNDLLDEDSEDLVITLSNPVGAIFYLHDSITLTITDDDPMPTIQFTAATQTVVEGLGAADFTVTLSAPSGKQVSDWRTVTDGSAQGAGVDYAIDPGFIVFAPGETSKTFSATITDDLISEADEDFTVALSSFLIANATLGSIASNVVTITDYVDPVADFSADTTNGLDPLVVTFTDASTPGSEAITGWSWDFDGDGIEDSTLQAPLSYTYAFTGNHTVSLTVTAGTGSDTETKINYIHIISLPTAEFNADALGGVVPLVVNFSNNSALGTEALTSWSWTFTGGDITTSSLETPPAITYATPGTYTVSLTVTTAAGSDIETKDTYIFALDATDVPCAECEESNDSGGISVGSSAGESLGDDLTVTRAAQTTAFDEEYLYGVDAGLGPDGTSPSIATPGSPSGLLGQSGFLLNTALNTQDIHTTINARSMAMIVQETDVDILTIGDLSLNFTRTFSNPEGSFRDYYSVNQALKKNVGTGWTHNYNIHIRQSSQDGSLMLYDERGNSAFFPRVSTVGGVDTYVLESTTIERDQATDLYTMDRPDGKVYTFTGLGNQEYARLTSITDRHGNQVTLTYESTSIPQGRLSRVDTPVGDDRYLEFTYTNSKQLEFLYLKDGSGATIHTVEYGYNVDDDLISVKENASAETVVYEYAEYLSGGFTGNYISKFIDRLATEFLVTYQYSGEVLEKITIDYPDGLKTDYTRDLATGDVTVENFDGATSLSKLEYVLNGSGTRVAARRIYSDATQYEEWKYLYDGSGNVYRIEPPSSTNAYVRYTFSPEQRIASVKSGDSSGGPTWSWAYDPGSLDPDTRIDSDGALTDYTWDPSRRLSDLIVPNKSGGRTFQYVHYPNGELNKVIDDYGDLYTIAYDVRGYVDTFDERDFGLTDYAHDDLGNVSSVTDPQGVTTNYFYEDARHPYSVTRITQPGQPDQTFSYDANGNLDIQSLDGGVTTEDFDFDTLGRMTEYKINTVTDRSVAYSKLGQIETVIDVTDGTSTYAYDGYGRVTRYDDGVAVARNYLYDDFGNIVAVEDDGGAALTLLPGEAPTASANAQTSDLTDQLDHPISESSIQHNQSRGSGTRHKGTGKGYAYGHNFDIVYFEPQEATVAEDVGTYNLLVSVTRTPGSPPRAVNVTVRVDESSTATDGVDYFGGFDANRKVTFKVPADQDSFIIPIGIYPDGVTEGPETVVMDLTVAGADIDTTRNQFVLTIVDEALAAPPVVDINPVTQTVFESDPPVDFTVSLSFNLALDVTVPFSVIDLQTQGASDYTVTPANGILVIPAGEPSGIITLTPVNDSIVESDEAVLLALGSDITNGSQGVNSSASLTILDTDVPLTVLLDGNGTTSVGSSDYDLGTDVTITATENSGGTFNGWTGEIGGADGTLATITVTMDQARTITAHFGDIYKDLDFTADVTEGLGPLAVQFSIQGLLSQDPALTFQWRFGDGSAESTVREPAHTYAAPGYYTVSLIATNGVDARNVVKERYIWVQSTVEEGKKTILSMYFGDESSPYWGNQSLSTNLAAYRTTLEGLADSYDILTALIATGTPPSMVQMLGGSQEEEYNADIFYDTIVSPLSPQQWPELKIIFDEFRQGKVPDYLIITLDISGSMWGDLEGVTERFVAYVEEFYPDCKIRIWLDDLERWGKIVDDQLIALTDAIAAQDMEALRGYYGMYISTDQPVVDLGTVDLGTPIFSVGGALTLHDAPGNILTFDFYDGPLQYWIILFGNPPGTSVWIPDSTRSLSIVGDLNTPGSFSQTLTTYWAGGRLDVEVIANVLDANGDDVSDPPIPPNPEPTGPDTLDPAFEDYYAHDNNWMFTVPDPDTGAYVMVLPGESAEFTLILPLSQNAGLVVDKIGALVFSMGGEAYYSLKLESITEQTSELYATQGADEIIEVQANTFQYNYFTPSGALLPDVTLSGELKLTIENRGATTPLGILMSYLTPEAELFYTGLHITAATDTALPTGGGGEVVDEDEVGDGTGPVDPNDPTIEPCLNTLPIGDGSVFYARRDSTLCSDSELTGVNNFLQIPAGATLSLPLTLAQGVVPDVYAIDEITLIAGAPAQSGGINFYVHVEARTASGTRTLYSSTARGDIFGVEDGRVQIKSVNLGDLTLLPEMDQGDTIVVIITNTHATDTLGLYPHHDLSNTAYNTQISFHSMDGAVGDPGEPPPDPCAAVDPLSDGAIYYGRRDQVMCSTPEAAGVNSYLVVDPTSTLTFTLTQPEAIASNSFGLKDINFFLQNAGGEDLSFDVRVNVQKITGTTTIYSSVNEGHDLFVPAGLLGPQVIPLSNTVGLPAMDTGDVIELVIENLSLTETLYVFPHHDLSGTDFYTSISFNVENVMHGTFQRFVIGDADGFGWRQGDEFLVANPQLFSVHDYPGTTIPVSANVDGTNFLTNGDYLPDFDLDGLVDAETTGTTPGDDWDNRSDAEVGGQYLTGVGFDRRNSSSTGSQFTDITLSQSYTASAATVDATGDPSGLGRVFGPFPKTSGDSADGLSNLPGVNGTGFVFDFYVQETDLAQGTPLYLNMLCADYDAGTPRVALRFAPGGAKASLITSFDIDAFTLDGQIQRASIAMTGEALRVTPYDEAEYITFDDIFTLETIGGANWWHGYLQVDFIDPWDGNNQDAYMVIDFIEIAVNQDSLGGFGSSPEDRRFETIRLGDIDGFGWDSAKALADHNPSVRSANLDLSDLPNYLAANPDGVGILAPGDFLPDIDTNGVVAESASGWEPGDDWDRRSTEEAGGRYHTGRGYRIGAVSNFTRGSEYTDLTISSSYTVSAGAGDQVLTGALARTFGAFPTADGDSDTGSNLPGEDNNLPFIFDFYLDSFAIDPAKPLYVTLTHGDLDETRLEFSLETTNGATVDVPFVTTGVTGDGEIHSSFAVIDGTTLSFDDVFTWNAATAEWHGYLEVTLKVIAGQTEDPYFAIDFVALSTSLRDIGVIRVPEDYVTVQAAINAALNGNTILVAPGTYLENLNTLGKNITLRSLDPLDPAIVANTVLDGDIDANPATADGPVIAYRGTEQGGALRGFTIQNGDGIFGGGISGNGTGAIIENNVIVNNTAVFGGGIFSVRGLVLNNEIASNTATDSGGGVYNAHQLWQNHIHDNSAVNEGGGVWSSATQIVNNLIVNNQITGASIAGAGLHKQSYSPDSLVAHNTFVDNTWNGLVVNVIDEAGGLPLRNNILWDSAGTPATPTDWDRLQTSDLLFNLIVGAPTIGTDPAWNLGDDPVFNPAPDDFTLAIASPAVDAGGALTPPVPLDIVDAARAALSPDIGAYESTHDGTTQDYVYLEIVSDGTNGAPLTLDGYLSPSLQTLVDGGASLDWKWTFDGADIENETENTLNIDPVVPTDSGAYRAVATINSAAVHTSAAYTLPTIPVVVYVPDIDDSSAELVIDPDFEDSTSGAWTGDTENIWQYEPINNPEGAPLSGSHFLWFGDYEYPTIAWITQTIVIPGTGNATLNFYLYTQHASVAYGDTDQVQVSLDGTVLSPTPIYANDVTYQSGYTLVSIDVSAWADGNSHTLKFETTQTGSTDANDITNFFIDGISIRTGTDFTDNWGIDLTPSILNFGFVEPGQTATQTVKVINTGSTPLVGSAIANEPFFVTGNADYDIPPGGTGTVEITFAPIDSETYHDFVDFTGGGDLNIHVLGNSIHGLTMPDSLNVSINEIAPWNTNGVTDQDGDHSNWIELLNDDTVPILLDDWIIEYLPEGGATTTWTFPDGITIGAGDFLVVFASGKAVTAADLGLHTNFTLNQSISGTLTLRNPGGNPTNQSPMYFPILTQSNSSWAYYGASNSTLQASPPTPIMANLIANANAWTVILDPGHGIAPVGDSATTGKSGLGTFGIWSNTPEAKATWLVVKQIEERIDAWNVSQTNKITVVITKPDSATNIPNVERAQQLGNNNAKLFISIHFDSAEPENVEPAQYPHQTFAIVLPERFTEMLGGVPFRTDNRNQVEEILFAKKLVAAVAAVQGTVDAGVRYTGTDANKGVLFETTQQHNKPWYEWAERLYFNQPGTPTENRGIAVLLEIQNFRNRDRDFMLNDNTNSVPIPNNYRAISDTIADVIIEEITQ